MKLSFRRGGPVEILEESSKRRFMEELLGQTVIVDNEEGLVGAVKGSRFDELQLTIEFENGRPRIFNLLVAFKNKKLWFPSDEIQHKIQSLFDEYSLEEEQKAVAREAKNKENIMKKKLQIAQRNNVVSTKIVKRSSIHKKDDLAREFQITTGYSIKPYIYNSGMPLVCGDDTLETSPVKAYNALTNIIGLKPGELKSNRAQGHLPNVTKEGWDIWFICHSNLSDKGDHYKWGNRFYQKYCDVFHSSEKEYLKRKNNPNSKAGRRLIFTKINEKYVFVGVYEFKEFIDKNLVCRFELVSRIYDTKLVK